MKATESMGFRKELEETINRHCAEGGSNTPDFILAKYLTSCLAAFDVAVCEREQWYGKVPATVPGDQLNTLEIIAPDRQ